MRSSFGALVVGAVILSGCATEPGRTTAIASATGGAIGAGLGAIVGSQTGSAGAGLAIGAAAGAAAGGLVGNSIEAQDRTLTTQQEALRRQEQQLAAQRSELAELRRLDGDTSARSRYGGERIKLRPPVLNGTSRFGTSMTYGSTASSAAPALNRPTMVAPTTSYSYHPSASSYSTGTGSSYTGESTTTASSVSRAPYEAPTAPKFPSISSSGTTSPAPSGGALKEKTVISTPARIASAAPAVTEPAHVKDEAPSLDESAGSLEANDAPTDLGAITEGPNGDSKSEASDTTARAVTERSATEPSSSTECGKADSEITQANESAEAADKLFHLRRALRLCPDNARYHNQLGQVYRTLNRKADAEFEFGEALRLDPHDADAKSNLDAIRGKGSASARAETSGSTGTRW